MDSNGKIIASSAANYEKDLGSKLNTISPEITQDAKMWTRAIIFALEKLKENHPKFDFQSVVGISGCGQQHGSVYFKSDKFPKIEEILDDDKADDFFLFNGDSPIWMDTSTQNECNFIESQIAGGRDMLKERTGSYAFTRFTASQILKRTKICGKNEIKKICLVSSFVPSLLTEKFCPIDYADGSGMNLLNLKLKKWDKEISEIIGLDSSSLDDTLKSPCSPTTNFGFISDFWCRKFDFNPKKCQIISFTGDNPSALIGTGGIKVNTCIISLGTSDTIFLNLGQNLPKNSKQAHIFCSPINDSDFMALCCYRNGSLVRENLLKENNIELNQENWDKVSKILMNPGGAVDLDLKSFSMRFDLKEITPNLGPDFQRTFSAKETEDGHNIPFEQKIYNLINGQFIAKRAHIQKFLNLPKIEKLIVTGGASKNLGIVQMISNVFQCPVFSNKNSSEAAAFGGCLKAAYVITGEFFEPELELLAEPDRKLFEMYENLVETYLELEEDFLKNVQ